MPEVLKAKSYEQRVDKFENEHLISAEAESLHEHAEITANLTATEALKQVAEVNEKSTTENPLEKLEKAQNESEPQINGSISAEVRKNTAQREIKNLRQHESLPERSLSRLTRRRSLSIHW
jgi:hypothetical protein